MAISITVNGIQRKRQNSGRVRGRATKGNFFFQVESTFEFAHVCRNLDFHNFVFWMKESNPVNEICNWHWNTVTDGLGDTIRVSLTEPPEEEIDTCRRLAKFGMQAAKLEKGVAPFEEKHHHYFNFQRRTSQPPIQKEGGRLQAHNPSCSSQKSCSLIRSILSNFLN
ncbi:hypothetical protein SUGI_0963780 [Cryptomeria japonica]|nr:hypothetical protein SUGI_0963780 [Cryptomeria japonica]